MNPKSIRLVVVAAILLGLGTAGCEDENVIGAYCNLHSYCYSDSYDNCVQTREYQEEQAVTLGEECHNAFLAFHECIAELSCPALDEYYTDGSHCGTEHAAWQNRCLPVVP